jgi:hypothetical protein
MIAIAAHLRSDLERIQGKDRSTRGLHGQLSVMLEPANEVIGYPHKTQHQSSYWLHTDDVECLQKRGEAFGQGRRIRVCKHFDFQPYRHLSANCTSLPAYVGSSGDEDDRALPSKGSEVPTLFQCKYRGIFLVEKSIIS